MSVAIESGATRDESCTTTTRRGLPIFNLVSNNLPVLA
jgi:hypothetical protein